MEKETIGRELTALETRALNMTVNSDADYAAAGAVLKEVKALANKVKEYWEPLRVSAKKAYDDVLAKKKEMTDPLDKTEKVLKAEMAGYTKRKELERKLLEEAQRKMAQEEAEKRLREAVDAESNGDAASAEMAYAEAEVYDNLSSTITVAKEKVKADGVSVRKTFKIKSVDPSRVPVNFNGVCIRPVDEKAVLALIKAADGNIKIDGIEFEEDAVISVRA